MAAITDHRKHKMLAYVEKLRRENHDNGVAKGTRYPAKIAMVTQVAALLDTHNQGGFIGSSAEIDGLIRQAALQDKLIGRLTFSEPGEVKRIDTKGTSSTLLGRCHVRLNMDGSLSMSIGGENYQPVLARWDRGVRSTAVQLVKEAQRLMKAYEAIIEEFRKGLAQDGRGATSESSYGDGDGDGDADADVSWFDKRVNRFGLFAAPGEGAGFAPSAVPNTEARPLSQLTPEQSQLLSKVDAMKEELLQLRRQYSKLASGDNREPNKYDHKHNVAYVAYHTFDSLKNRMTPSGVPGSSEFNPHRWYDIELENEKLAERYSLDTPFSVTQALAQYPMYNRSRSRGLEKTLARAKALYDKVTTEMLEPVLAEEPGGRHSLGH